MTLSQYLTVIAIAGLLAWVGLVLVLFRMNPDTGGSIALFLFYASLFLASVTTLTLVGFGIRRLIDRETLPVRQIGVAARQAVLFGLLVVVLFLLLGTGFFAWWHVPLLLLFTGAIEYFFLAASTQ
ncbi:MAG: hypothetical protein WCV86_00180 [Patescibacteria group bacterium]|jgi:hypothetical protein